MVIKVPKPTKAERIRFILDCWDPCRKREKAGFMYYNYEAEALAQGIRKNSRVDSVAKMVQEVVNDKLRIEGLGYTVDDESARRVAEVILAQMK